MNEDLRTSPDWETETGIKVMDPDGWDRAGDFWASWTELITREEFMRRVSTSTVVLPREFQIPSDWPVGGWIKG